MQVRASRLGWILAASIAFGSVASVIVYLASPNLYHAMVSLPRFAESLAYTLDRADLAGIITKEHLYDSRRLALDDAIAEMRRRLRVDTASGPSFTVAFDYPDGEAARRVVMDVLTIFGDRWARARGIHITNVRFDPRQLPPIPAHRDAGFGPIITGLVSSVVMFALLWARYSGSKCGSGSAFC